MGQQGPNNDSSTTATTTTPPAPAATRKHTLLSVPNSPPHGSPFLPSPISPQQIHASPTDGISTEGEEDQAHEASLSDRSDIHTSKRDETQEANSPLSKPHVTATPHSPTPLSPTIPTASPPLDRPRRNSNNPFLQYLDQGSSNPVKEASTASTSVASSLSGLQPLGPSATGLNTRSSTQSTRQSRYSTSSTLVGSSSTSATPSNPHPPTKPWGGPPTATHRRNTASLDMKKAALRNASGAASLAMSRSGSGSGTHGDGALQRSGSGKKRKASVSAVVWPATPFELDEEESNENKGKGRWYRGQEDGEEDEDDLHTEGGLESATPTGKRSRKVSTYPPGYGAQHHYQYPQREGLFEEDEDEYPYFDKRGDFANDHFPEKTGKAAGDDVLNDATPYDFHFTEQRQVADTQFSNPYANLAMGEAIQHLVPVAPCEYERYIRGYTHPVVRDNPYCIPPLTTSFNGPRLPQGWRTFVHPEGTRYFYCDVPEHPVPVLTEAWIYDEEIYVRLQSYMNQIFEYMRQHDIVLPRYSPPSPQHSKTASPSSQEAPGPSSPPHAPREQKTSPKHPTPHAHNHPLRPQDVAPVVLVLEFRLTGRIGYYFASHLTQTLFWLDPFDFDLMISEVHIVHTEWLAGLQMRSEYWHHNELFPHMYELEERDLGCMENFIGFAIGDVLTSTPGTTEPRDLDQLKQIQAVVHRYQMKGWERRRRNVGERRFICRVLQQFYHERFINLYGERGARLSLWQSIHYSPHRRQKPVERSLPSAGSRKPWYKYLLPLARSPPLHEKHASGTVEPAEEPQNIYGDIETVDADPAPDARAKKMATNSVWMEVLSVCMFGSPAMHMRKLRDMSVDSIVNRHSLTKYADKMVEEWRDITITGTVVLTANVSFLTIQSVDEEGTLGPNRTNAQRASYFSVLASMGTIVFSLLLLRQHREAMSLTFITNRSVSRWGMESLALMYGMPFALMIYSMISFFASFAIMWLEAHDYVVIGVVSVCCLFFTVIILWAITAAYEKRPYKSIPTKMRERARGIGHKVGKETKKAVRSARQRVSTVVDTNPSILDPSSNSPSTNNLGDHHGSFRQHRRSGSSMTMGTLSGPPPEYSKEDLTESSRNGHGKRKTSSLRSMCWLYPDPAWFGRDRVIENDRGP